MKINEIEFEVKALTRAQRKELRKAGISLLKKASECQDIAKKKKEGELFNLEDMPLDENELDVILEIAFRDQLEDLEKISLIEQMTLAAEVFFSCLDNPAKN